MIQMFTPEDLMGFIQWPIKSGTEGRQQLSVGTADYQASEPSSGMTSSMALIAHSIMSSSGSLVVIF